MSGAWAREADAFDASGGDLASAAWSLSSALCVQARREDQAFHLKVASAIIRRERKRLDASEPRLPDWSPDYSDERLMWITLRVLAETGAYHLTTLQQSYRLREAEAALRTLHKRGRS